MVEQQVVPTWIEELAEAWEEKKLDTHEPHELDTVKVCPRCHGEYGTGGFLHKHWAKAPQYLYWYWIHTDKHPCYLGKNLGKWLEPTEEFKQQTEETGRL